MRIPRITALCRALFFFADMAFPSSRFPHGWCLRRMFSRTIVFLVCLTISLFMKAVAKTSAAPIERIKVR